MVAQSKERKRQCISKQMFVQVFPVIVATAPHVAAVAHVAVAAVVAVAAHVAAAAVVAVVSQLRFN
jgi:hypothetical protein